MKRLSLTILCLLLAVAFGGCQTAKLQTRTGPPVFSVAGVFNHHMVLQRGQPIPVWGWGVAGTRVTVALERATASNKIGPDGRWQVNLPAQPAGGPFELRIATSTTNVVFSNVMLGDVWFCGGQSNMEWPVIKSKQGEVAMAGATNQQIRLLSIRRRIAAEPLQDINGESWKVCSPGSVRHFSAVGYYFGQEIQQTTGVPIGLISSNVGGTPAESWMREETLLADPVLAQYVARHRAAVEKFKIRCEQLATNESAELSKDMRAADPFKAQAPTVLYNAMLHPLIPYGIKGVIWYQGESNTSRAQEYHRLFAALIESWRAEWGQGPFPFLWVQLANFDAMPEQPADTSWAELREAQSQTLRLTNTAQAVAIDVGEADDIHPGDKQTVGHRLALAAQRVAYGEDLVYSGPVCRDAVKVNNGIQLTFDHVGTGLVARQGELVGFEVGGADGEFRLTTATIQAKDKVIVAAQDLTGPVTVRYAWSNNPEGCNLFNREGLPTSPFRITVDQAE